MFGKVKTFFNILKVTAYESVHMRGNTYDKLVQEALLLCHALEKGMGIKNVKKGYGKDKALQLLADVQELLAIRENTYISQECVAVLNAYVYYQQKEGNDISEIKRELDNIKISSDYDGGYKIVSNVNLANFDYGEFSASRHSLRMTSSEKVTSTEILKAIQIASFAPSACNRQPWKVYYSFQEETNRKMAALVQGNKSFADDVRYYCVLTVKRSLFGGVNIASGI